MSKIVLEMRPMGWIERVRFRVQMRRYRKEQAALYAKWLAK